VIGTKTIRARDAEKIADIAVACRPSQTQISLAWMLRKSEVTAPFVGATKMQHLDEALTALSITIRTAQVGALEAPYLPIPFSASHDGIDQNGISINTIHSYLIDAPLTNT
jgi:aryl-alcohol dehydrogenase-like predicted oxidoreductase